MERFRVGSALLRIVLVMAVAWAAFAACSEIGGALAGWDGRAGRRLGVMGWREGIPQVVRFRRFVEAARAQLPAGSTVVFTSPSDGADQQFFRSRWAAYLLPEMDVVPLSDPAAARVGEFLLGYGRQVDHPRLELVRRLPGGWLYRVRPAGEPG